jgi:hypothetical protein
VSGHEAQRDSVSFANVLGLGLDGSQSEQRLGRLRRSPMMESYANGLLRWFSVPLFRAAILLIALPIVVRGHAT